MRCPRKLAAFGMTAAFLLATGCACQPCKQSAENLQLVQAAFDAVSAGDFDALDKLIATDYIRHCQATPDVHVDSLAAFKDFLRKDRETCPDQQIVVKHLVAQGDLVAFWATYTGTQLGPMGPFPATGKSMSLDFSGIHRVSNGKVVETWLTWDNLSALTQLGLFPPPPVEEPATAP